MNYSRLVIVPITALSAALALSSCAMMQKLTCNSSVAVRGGQDDAAKGATDKPGRSSSTSCEGAEFTPAQYQADYDRGYSEKKAEICQAGYVSKKAMEDGTSGADQAQTSAFLKTCASASLDKVYSQEFYKGYCSQTRAMKVGRETGEAMKPLEMELYFVGCSPSQVSAVKSAFSEAYRVGKDMTIKKRGEEFQRTTGTAQFDFMGRPYSASCEIDSARGQATVDVQNPYADQVTIQRNWKFSYFDSNFQKLTEDQLTEAVLLGGGSKKKFSKLTLPRDASYCRAE